jgi:RNA polymerase sigma-70 factor (ECF subfamily)
VLPESELVRRCQSGDEPSFEGLFHLHARRVKQTAFLITGDHRVAEELMQEAFTQAFRTITQLREPAAFAGWLSQITVRLARRASIRRSSERAATDRLAILTPSSLPSHADESDRRQLLWSAIQSLPESQRTVVVLHYYEDRPLAEIANLLGVPQGTVKSWLHRARTTLAAYLSEDLARNGGEG